MSKKCPECGYRDGLETKKKVEKNEVIEGGKYCPDCQTEFDEDTVVQWDDLDFPIWISMESYNDDWQMYRDFLYETNLYEGDFNGMPNARNMKYCVFHVYFKVNEDGSIDGPYNERNGELI